MIVWGGYGVNVRGMEWEVGMSSCAIGIIGGFVYSCSHWAAEHPPSPSPSHSLTPDLSPPQVRQAAERGVASAGFGAAAFMKPLLQNLCLSLGDNEELCYCLKTWQVSSHLPHLLAYALFPIQSYPIYCRFIRHVFISSLKTLFTCMHPHLTGAAGCCTQWRQAQ